MVVLWPANLLIPGEIRVSLCYSKCGLFYTLGRVLTIGRKEMVLMKNISYIVLTG